MRRSDSITALAKALVLAQGEMESPKKTKEAKLGAYSYKYADLGAVKDSYKTALGAHGLSIVHSLAPVEGHLVLTTTLLHESGEWMASDYPIPTYPKPQEQGSALTYFKRYNVCALLDIAAEDDDDGAAAQEGTPKQAKAAPKPEPVKPSALTQTEIESVHSLAKKAGYKSTAELAPILHNICGVSKASELSKNELPAVLEALGAMAAQKVPA
jgi:hypothetical protein